MEEMAVLEVAEEVLVVEEQAIHQTNHQQAETERQRLHIKVLMAAQVALQIFLVAAVAAQVVLVLLVMVQRHTQVVMADWRSFLLSQDQRFITQAVAEAVLFQAQQV
jgi:hypothetical protein